MKFLGAIAVHAIIALVLITGIVLASHGSFWLLGLGAAGYLFLFAKYGCSAH